MVHTMIIMVCTIINYVIYHNSSFLLLSVHHKIKILPSGVSSCEGSLQFTCGFSGLRPFVLFVCVDVYVPIDNI